MKISTYLFALMLIVSISPLQAQQIDYAAHGETPFEPGQLLVQIFDTRSAERIFADLSEINGTTTELAFGEVVSERLDIYLLTFNQDQVDPFDMLKAVREHSAIHIAQFNHLVSRRETVPNDPQFDQQWHHVNTGQSGGTPDADIDSDLAWDITTGGLTALGDEIVVCVIEGGNLNHPDLSGNAWVNENEIPGNGIDDDGNGYIDDYLGWNVSSNNDNGVLQGLHGTQVFGMIGAKGDNNLGVAGANWDVKLMSVAGQNLSNESSVVAAYTYPLVMRELYDETNGALGAFVVATNASWGIDGGNPDNSPLWCGVYETLGEAGILNCGATANNNVNIDNVGDLPTACPSPYMVSVTATNHNDVRTFSGYGVNTINVGAPGENVVTTSGTNGYGSTSGTSFASPLTAGVIALLYSAPCPSLIQIAKADPQMGADMIMEALYEGVDIIPNLLNEVSTGGRINAYNSLMHILNNCADGGCITPFALSGTQEPNTTNYTLSWSGLDPETYDLRYRVVGDPDWTEITGLTETTYLATTLLYCETYEFQVRANCEEESSEYSDSFVWETDGCCENPLFTASQIISTGAVISWSSVLAAENFDVRYRVQNTTDWTVINAITDTETALNNLEECTPYEVQLQTNCIDDEDAGWSASLFFNTSGCGACQDLDYCASFGEDSSEEWIESVQFSAFSHVSGNDGGYADFTDNPHLMVIGSTQQLTLTPGFSGPSYPEQFRIWIDYNQDGEFTQNEMVYDSGEGSEQAVTGSFTIPQSALSGSTRMRVVMRYVGGLWGPGPPPEQCGGFAYGETEDYCVFLEEVVSVDELTSSDISIFPNPANDVFTVDLGNYASTMQELSYKLIDMTGRVVETNGFVTTRDVINVTHLQSGMYSLHIFKGKEQVATKPIVITK